jgi:hypothetical protein
MRPDGTFCLAVLPGPGVVCVTASPQNSYAEAFVDDRELADFFHDGEEHGGNQQLLIAIETGGNTLLPVFNYNALALINPKENTKSLTLDVKLQPARILQGTVCDAEGRPLSEVEATGLTAQADEERLESASFAVTSLNPRRPRTIALYHGRQNLGRLITLRGDESGSLVVRLLPCGFVTGRIVNKEAKPIEGANVCIMAMNGARSIFLATDAAGRFRADLLPGAKYSLVLPRLQDRPSANKVDLEVESGQTKDLGDLSMGETTK